MPYKLIVYVVQMLFFELTDGDPLKISVYLILFLFSSLWVLWPVPCGLISLTDYTAIARDLGVQKSWLLPIPHKDCLQGWILLWWMSTLPSPSCCKNSSRYPALARLGSSVPKMVWTVIVIYPLILSSSCQLQITYSSFGGLI